MLKKPVPVVFVDVEPNIDGAVLVVLKLNGAVVDVDAGAAKPGVTVVIDVAGLPKILLVDVGAPVEPNVGNPVVVVVLPNIDGAALVEVPKMFVVAAG